jgi:prevent-host-death family protein
MGISLTQGIRSITDLKRNTNQILKQIHDSKKPVVLTVNGKAEAVLIGAKEYDDISNALAMFKLILAAEDDIKNGRERDIGDFFKEFRRDRRI